MKVKFRRLGSDQFWPLAKFFVYRVWSARGGLPSVLHRLRAGANNGISVAKSSLGELPVAFHQDSSNHDLRDRSPLLPIDSGICSVLRAPRVSTPSRFVYKPPHKNQPGRVERNPRAWNQIPGGDQSFVGIRNFAIQRPRISRRFRRWLRQLP